MKAHSLLVIVLTLVAGCMGNQESHCESSSGDDGSRNVCSSRESFAYARSGDRVTERSEYSWKTTARAADFSLNLDMSAGSVTVTITDAGGKTLYNRSHGASGSSPAAERLEASASGPWTVVVNLGAADGSVALTLTAA